MERMRIKYYSNRDLSTPYNLAEAESYIKNNDAEADITDINDAMEVFNVTKLIDSGTRLKKWDDNNYNELKENNKRLKGTLGKYCQTIKDDNLAAFYKDTSWEYRDDFLTVLEEYKVYDRIGEEAFSKLLGEASIDNILRHKKLVKQYDSTIAEFMLSNRIGAETLITHYCSKQTDGPQYSIPQGLLKDDIKEIIAYYIDSEEANPNYLSLVAQPIKDDKLSLDDKILFKAEKRREDICNRIISEHKGLIIGAEVSFADVDEDNIDVNNPLVPKIVYSRRWIRENQDYPTLLNNLIYVFGQVDRQRRCTFVSKKRSLGLFEGIGMKGKKEYIVGTAFHQSQYIQILNMLSYDNELQNLGINLEYLFKWFFEEYLKEEFGVDGFRFSPSSEGVTFTEKCRNLLCEVDSIIKQFKLYVEDGEIDRELLEFSSTPVPFEAVPSFSPRKYAYIDDEETAYAMVLLFSDQTMLGYTEKTRDKYNTLADLLINEKISLEDYREYQIAGINYLLERKYIAFDEYGYITLDTKKARVLKDYYYNDVINLYTVKDNDFLNELINEEKACAEGSLLSRPEQDYFDYVLNRHKFTNGPDLRNRYIHGTNPEEEKPDDYYKCLLILSLLVIKINEEFCERELLTHNLKT